MALLIFSPFISSVSSPASSRSTAIEATRSQNKYIALQPKPFNGIQIFTSTPTGVPAGRILTVRASIDTDGMSPEDDGPPGEDKEETVSVENLPLESKLQLKLEAKLRMKLAKKIRLRRKRLVRKRQLRKKGRWPPSKMKKNKNGLGVRSSICNYSHQLQLLQIGQ
ncbi:50S ribosomal protein 5 alpha, chloroplastic isoform X2 [Macadamia integrifolia]|uniref:50S ribosomal protein 5 alpha, chloroplastic isoform X2 n=1 Tax=Macadamia integrifolia TaxID=60698 RepID=UPI001C4EB5EA|nr:50S ribosomal protein 5 alpha, chloroplastic isoform X2 [Macadamia integrifolia]